MKFRAMLPLAAAIQFGVAGTSAAFVCTVSSTALIFSGYDVFSSQPKNSTGTVNVICSNNDRHPVPVIISLSSGIAGGFNPRQMLGFRDRLNYNLYTDATRSVVWGDGNGGTATVSAVASGNTGVTSTIYGVIAPRQNVSAGIYFDTLIVTVTW